MAEPNPRIVFDGVSKHFDVDSGSMKVVQDVSFSIGAGEFVALVGPSGCGKTTMLNMLAGFLKPSSGEVRLDGKPIEGPDSKRGMIFQDYGIFPWLTVEKNIEFGLRLRANQTPASRRREIVDHYTERMGLAEFRKAFPKMLSGGMKQRLALARAYAVDPEFLLMDEPFGALDAQTRSSMQAMLLETLEGLDKTVVLITHSVEEALFLATKILVISARPSRIRKAIDVSFEHPRDQGLVETREFSELRADVSELVMREYAAQQQQVRASG